MKKLLWTAACAIGSRLLNQLVKALFVLAAVVLLPLGDTLAAASSRDMAPCSCQQMASTRPAADRQHASTPLQVSSQGQERLWLLL